MINKLTVILVFIVLFASTVLSFDQNSKADLVIINAKVHTADKKNPKAEAAAIVENKFIAVGSNREIRPLIGEDTKIINAKGKLVLPGFNDSHVHFMSIGNQFFTVDLSGVKSEKEIPEIIKEYVKFLAKGSWILGGRWKNENWTSKETPTKELIDEVTNEHPVFLYNSDADAVLVNSLALEKAGINKDTPDVVFGEIERYEDGEPTGILKGKAIGLVKKFVPLLATNNKLAVAETASNYAASFGVTSVQDVHSDNNVEVFRTLLGQGKLKTRIYDCTPLPKWTEMADSGIKRATGDGFVRTGCLKHFSDGDYAILPELTKQFIAADKADLQITIHAIGSRANDIILTAYENVIKANGKKDRRLMIEHAHTIRPEDIERFGRSNVIASMQPHLFWGGEPYQKLLKTNAVLAFGSDASITDLNPLYGIHAAVNRGSSDELLSVEQAVYAYTMGSAYAEFQEDVKGSITVGKFADMVILSDDIFTIPSEKIRNTKVLTTIVDGKVVYESN